MSDLSIFFMKNENWVFYSKALLQRGKTVFNYCSYSTSHTVMKKGNRNIKTIMIVTHLKTIVN